MNPDICTSATFNWCEEDEYFADEESGWEQPPRDMSYSEDVVRLYLLPYNFHYGYCSLAHMLGRALMERYSSGKKSSAKLKPRALGLRLELPARAESWARSQLGIHRFVDAHTGADLGGIQVLAQQVPTGVDQVVRTYRVLHTGSCELCSRGAENAVNDTTVYLQGT